MVLKQLKTSLHIMKFNILSKVKKRVKTIEKSLLILFIEIQNLLYIKMMFKNLFKNKMNL